MGIWASDCETTGLLDMMMEQESPKLHNFCSLSIDSDEVRLFEVERIRRSCKHGSMKDIHLLCTMGTLLICQH